jgi:PAS domain S-box-containing protein
VVSSIADITLEKKLSFELQQREALFNEFMKQSPNLALVVDKEMNLVFGNPAWHRYFGTSAEASTGRKIYEIVPDSVSKALYKKHMAVMESGFAGLIPIS